MRGAEAVDAALEVEVLCEGRRETSARARRGREREGEGARGRRTLRELGDVVVLDAAGALPACSVNEVSLPPETVEE